MSPQTERPTVPSLIRYLVKHIHPDTHPFLAHKVGEEWIDITYREALDKIDSISASYYDVMCTLGVYAKSKENKDFRDLRDKRP